MTTSLLLVAVTKAGTPILLDGGVEETRHNGRSLSTFEIVDATGEVVAKVPFGG